MSKNECRHNLGQLLHATKGIILASVLFTVTTGLFYYLQTIFNTKILEANYSKPLLITYLLVIGISSFYVFKRKINNDYKNALIAISYFFYIVLFSIGLRQYILNAYSVYNQFLLTFLIAVQLIYIPFLLFFITKHTKKSRYKKIIFAMLLIFKEVNTLLIYIYGYINSTISIQSTGALTKELYVTLWHTVTVVKEDLIIVSILMVMDYFVLKEFIYYTQKNNIICKINRIFTKYINTPKLFLSKNNLAYLGTVSVLILTIIGLSFNETVTLFRNSFKENSAFGYYAEVYEKSLKIGTAYEINNLEDTVASNENIFFLQLESLNSDLVNDITTPNLVKLSSEKGVLVKNYQATAVTTTHNQESFLCTQLPPLAVPLSFRDKSIHQKLNCLPQILKNLGYTTIYMQGYSTSFNNMDAFLHNIGYDFVYGTEIFDKNDEKLDWGYSDEVALDRFFEILQKNHKNKKLFVHMEIGATNHLPFNAYLKNKNLEKYRKTPTIRDKNKLTTNFVNSIYIQDRIFGEAFEKWYFPFYGKNSNLFIFGDHSWPLEKHINNKFNISAPWQENFVTSLAFIPSEKSKGKYNIGITNNTLTTSLGLQGTVIDLATNQKAAHNYPTFYNELLKSSQNSEQIRHSEYCVLSLQPYSDTYIAVTFYPYKYLFNKRKDSIYKFNLSEDPLELNPLEIEDKYKTNPKKILEDCFRTLNYNTT